MANNGIFWTSDTLTPGIKGFTKNMDNRIGILIQAMAPVVESHMKTNAPWNDQTGNARGGLRTTYENDGGVHRLILSHSVNYGIYLETRWGGRYAVIVPTIQVMGPQVMDRARTLLSMMSGRI